MENPYHVTTRRSRREGPRAIWHCEIASESAYIPKIFFAPAARQEECGPPTFMAHNRSQARRGGHASGIVARRCDGAHPDALQVALVIEGDSSDPCEIMARVHRARMRCERCYAIHSPLTRSAIAL